MVRFETRSSVLVCEACHCLERVWVLTILLRLFFVTFTKGSIQLNVLVYVDDLIISDNDSAAISLFKAYLVDCFKMKDLGPLKYYLGIEVARSTSGLFLFQRKYTLDIILRLVF